MEKTKKLVIIGDSAFAEVAYECFTHDSEYEVVGFSVESAYIKKSELFGLPIIPFEQLCWANIASFLRTTPSSLLFVSAITLCCGAATT